MTLTLQMLVERVLAAGGTMDTLIVGEHAYQVDLVGFNDVHVVEVVDQWLDTMKVAYLQMGLEDYRQKPQKPRKEQP